MNVFTYVAAPGSTQPSALHPMPTPAAPERYELHEKSRVRAAATAAKRLYPGPVGDLISRELLSWDDFGFRFGDGALMARVVDDLLRPPADTATAGS